MIRSNEMVFFLCARIVLIRWQLMHYFLLLCCFFQVLDLLKLIFFARKMWMNIVIDDLNLVEKAKLSVTFLLIAVISFLFLSLLFLSYLSFSMYLFCSSYRLFLFVFGASVFDIFSCFFVHCCRCHGRMALTMSFACFFFNFEHTCILHTHRCNKRESKSNQTNNNDANQNIITAEKNMSLLI